MFRNERTEFINHEFGEIDKYGRGEATGFIHRLRGCETVGWIHSCWVKYGEHGKGIGSAAHLERLKWMKENDFDYSLATVQADNEPQLKIMKKNGWKELDRFHNTSTEHEVIIFGKDLNK
jgi:hypothetical protein